MQHLAIFGVGGLGRELLFLIESTHGHVAAFLDDHADGSCHGVPIHTLTDYARRATPGSPVAVGIGDSATRARVFDRVESTGLRVASLIDTTSRVGRTVEMGAGVVIAAGCTITTDIRLDRGVFVNAHSTIGHDCVLEPFATLFGNVNVSGGARIGRGATLGTGAVVLPGVSIGEGAMIGAGAVVTKDVPAWTTAVGVPARLLATHVPISPCVVSAA